MQMKILLLNGPPRSGKDEVLKIIARLGYQVHHEKFAKPLRDSVCGLLGISDEDLEERKARDPRVRQLMIGLSERVAKPILGDVFFAEACADRVYRDCRLGIVEQVVITDCGFQHEVDHFIAYLEWLGILPEFQLWTLGRAGCSFEGDSREYVNLDSKLGMTLCIYNGGTLEDLQYLVGHWAKEFFGSI
jgi:hypothetical protein